MVLNRNGYIGNVQKFLAIPYKLNSKTRSKYLNHTLTRLDAAETNVGEICDEK